MNCPNPKCGKTIDGFTVQNAAAVSEQFGRTVKCVAYCCEACGFILGVESDPLERDARMTKIEEQVTELVKYRQQEQKRKAAEMAAKLAQQKPNA